MSGERRSRGRVTPSLLRRAIDAGRYSPDEVLESVESDKSSTPGPYEGHDPAWNLSYEASYYEDDLSSHDYDYEVPGGRYPVKPAGPPISRLTAWDDEDTQDEEDNRQIQQLYRELNRRDDLAGIASGTEPKVESEVEIEEEDEDAFFDSPNEEEEMDFLGGLKGLKKIIGLGGSHEEEEDEDEDEDENELKKLKAKWWQAKYGEEEYTDESTDKTFKTEEEDSQVEDSQEEDSQEEDSQEEDSQEDNSEEEDSDELSESAEYDLEDRIRAARKYLELLRKENPEIAEEMDEERDNTELREQQLQEAYKAARVWERENPEEAEAALRERYFPKAYLKAKEAASALDTALDKAEAEYEDTEELIRQVEAEYPDNKELIRRAEAALAAGGWKEYSENKSRQQPVLDSVAARTKERKRKSPWPTEAWSTPYESESPAVQEAAEAKDPKQEEYEKQQAILDKVNALNQKRMRNDPELAAIMVGRPRAQQPARQPAVKRQKRNPEPRQSFASRLTPPKEEGEEEEEYERPLWERNNPRLAEAMRNNPNLFPVRTPARGSGGGRGTALKMTAADGPSTPEPTSAGPMGWYSVQELLALTSTTLNFIVSTRGLDVDVADVDDVRDAIVEDSRDWDDETFDWTPPAAENAGRRETEMLNRMFGLSVKEFLLLAYDVSVFRKELEELGIIVGDQFGA
ncbi:hypothetical protein M426DRAFT_13438 [Hypoxylon sp. CI-4A]|nr:hypothetical protein M426DRAFT_13438 [Hypoxylon sp. CI-4A]